MRWCPARATCAAARSRFPRGRGASPPRALSTAATPRPAPIPPDNPPVGREYRLGETERTALTVENTSSKPLAMELRLMSPESASAGSDENVGDLLGSAEVTLSPAKFTLPPGEKKQISGTVRFPKRKGIRGKTYMCVVSAAVVDLPVATQIYSRIYASVK